MTTRFSELLQRPGVERQGPPAESPLTGPLTHYLTEVEMFARIVFTLALLATAALAPFAGELVLNLGKPMTMLVLGPVGFALGTSGIATILERNAR